MRVYRDASIKRKLTLITMLTSSVALLLAGVSYVTYDLITFRRTMTRDLSTLAEIIGANSAAALAFDDQPFAKEVLTSLSVKQNIVGASLSKKDGRLFARYDRGPTAGGGRLDQPARRRSGWRAGLLEISRPIVFDREAIGSIAIQSDLQEFYARLERYGTLGALVMLVSSGIGFVLSSKLQRAISEPILHLAGTARDISQKKDYSIRAVRESRDEVGLLIDGFNEMLEQIQRRDKALTQLSDNLQQLYRLSTAMQEPLSLREHLARVLEAARKVVAVDRFYTWVVSDDGSKLAAMTGAASTDQEWAGVLGIEMPLSEAGAMRRAYRDGISLVFNEENPLPSDLRLRPPYADIVALRAKSFLVLPMIARGRTVGLLTADNKLSRRPILPETVDLLQIFASHAAVAIENARLFQEIEEKGRELQVLSKHKSQFLANMSHELRTPLNAILGYTELIQDGIYGAIPAAIHDVIGRVDKSGRHLLGLINDVLDLSKIEAGHLALSRTDASLTDVIHVAVSAMESLAAEKKLALTVTLGGDLPIGNFDERRITQVLLNLIGNAIKFTETGGVAVTATTSNGVFHIAVSDTGPGISAADQRKIFEEFQQADTSSTRKRGGTGLGLTIAKRIIEMHGGSLRVESVLGKGSTFRFALPVCPDARKAVT
jgi:signal transduction histidine kinase/HAMP domain-containing protein